MKQLALLLLIIGSSLHAADVTNDQTIQKFLSETWSPYCKGNSLLDCPSSQAEELRQSIRHQYEQGKSLDEIKVELEKVYGDKLKMTPDSNWRGELAYVLPWLAFCLCIGAVILFWRRKKKNPSLKVINPSTATSSSTIEKEIQERLY